MPLSHRDKHKIKFARFHFFMRAGARVRNNEISPKLTKNGHFSTFSKKNFDTNCDFLTQTHPGQAKNDKTNFVRRQLFMRADARVRFFEKFTKNGHFSTFSKKFFATNCDFLTQTHPGHAENDKTNFARRQLFMRADARVRFFEKFTKNGHFSTFSKKFFATNCDFLTQTHPGHAENDKTNFARRQLFMRADARVRFFEKF